MAPQTSEGNLSGLPQKSPFFPIDADRLITGNAHAMAFYDKYPVSKGHALVVPVRLVKSIYELPSTEQGQLWDLVAEVRVLLKAKHAPDSFNIGVNDGEAAGQTVSHAHIHIIPRYAGDVPDPRGGIRWILPTRASYWQK